MNKSAGCTYHEHDHVHPQELRAGELELGNADWREELAEGDHVDDWLLAGLVDSVRHFRVFFSKWNIFHRVKAIWASRYGKPNGFAIQG